MNYIPINILYLIYITSFTGFLNFYILGTTSNPLFFISSLILGSKFINFNLIKEYSFFPIIILIGTLFSYLVGNKVIDFRFLITIICTYIEFFLIQNIAYRTSKLNKALEHKILNRVSNFLILIFPIVLFLNLFNLHCLIFKCRKFGNIGMSFMTAEPSYVGLISIFYLSFYFLTFEKINLYKRRLILAICLIMTLMSRSLNTIFWIIFIATIIVIPYIFQYIINFLTKLKLNKNFKYFAISLPLTVVPFIFLYNTSNINDEIFFLFKNISNINLFNSINIASGDRINYFLASITSKPINLIFGHGLLSSSSIFDNNLSNLYDIFDNNYEINRGFKELGSKPHSFFGLIVFSNGLVGIVYFFREQINKLKKHIIGILRRPVKIQDKYFLQNHYFNFLPFIILFYSSTNTDPFKFISLYLYYVFYYLKKSY